MLCEGSKTLRNKFIYFRYQNLVKMLLYWDLVNLRDWVVDILLNFEQFVCIIQHMDAFYDKLYQHLMHLIMPNRIATPFITLFSCPFQFLTILFRVEVMLSTWCIGYSECLKSTSSFTLVDITIFVVLFLGTWNSREKKKEMACLSDKLKNSSVKISAC